MVQISKAVVAAILVPALGVAAIRSREDNFDMNDVFTREESNAALDARDPGLLGGLFKGVGKVFGFGSREDIEEEFDARDFEDVDFLDARNPEPEPRFRLNGIIKGAGHLVGNFIRDDETGDLYYVRDLNNIELIDARDPGLLGGIFKGVGKVFGFGSRELADDMDEVYAREFDDVEFDAREPEPLGLGGLFKGVGKVVGNFIRDDETGDVYFIRNLEEIDMD